MSVPLQVICGPTTRTTASPGEASPTLGPSKRLMSSCACALAGRTGELVRGVAEWQVRASAPEAGPPPSRVGSASSSVVRRRPWTFGASVTACRRRAWRCGSGWFRMKRRAESTAPSRAPRAWRSGKRRGSSPGGPAHPPPPGTRARAGCRCDASPTRGGRGRIPPRPTAPSATGRHVATTPFSTASASSLRPSSTSARA